MKRLGVDTILWNFNMKEFIPNLFLIWKQKKFHGIEFINSITYWQSNPTQQHWLLQPKHSSTFAPYSCHAPEIAAHVLQKQPRRSLFGCVRQMGLHRRKQALWFVHSSSYIRVSSQVHPNTTLKWHSVRRKQLQKALIPRLPLGAYLICRPLSQGCSLYRLWFEACIRQHEDGLWKCSACPHP